MVREESTDLRGDGGLYRELDEVLVGIKKAAKAILFYPGNHPARTEVLYRTHKQLTELLTRQAPLSLDITREGFSCAENPVGRDNPVLRTFAGELFLRGIQSIRFLPGIRLEDLQRLTELLTMDAADLSRQGGAKVFLQEHGVTTLEVEGLGTKSAETVPSPRPESSFREGSLEQGPSGDATPSAPAEMIAPQVAEMPGGEVGTEATAPPGMEIEEEPPPDLETLIADLHQTDRPARYESLTEELSRQGQAALAGGEADTSLRIMTALALELHPMNPKEETLTRYARAALISLLDERGCGLLLEGFCRGGTVPEDDLAHLLLTLKEEMAGPVVEQLLVEEEMAARRKLADLLTRMGTASLPALRLALQEPSWETARRLVPLLPTLETPEVAETMKELLRHSDPRIRRETIRIFGQMGVEVTGGPLLTALEDEETSVRQAAIATLGGLKVKVAVPRLRQIAESRPGTRDLGEQKTAIAALGMIGAPEALPTLIALLHRKRWLSRRVTEELRAAAAYALGAMGGAEATEALRAVAQSARPALRQACEAALSRAELPEVPEGVR